MRSVKKWLIDVSMFEMPRLYTDLTNAEIYRSPWDVRSMSLHTYVLHSSFSDTWWKYVTLSWKIMKTQNWTLIKKLHIRKKDLLQSAGQTAVSRDKYMPLVMIAGCRSISLRSILAFYGLNTQINYLFFWPVGKLYRIRWLSINFVGFLKSFKWVFKVWAKSLGTMHPTPFKSIQSARTLE